MMHGPEKSDSVIVAAKPTNKAEQSAAELVEPRTGTKGNAGQQSTLRTQSRINVSQALERIRKVAVTHPRWEPYAGKPHVRICAGGGEQSPSLPRTTLFAVATNVAGWHFRTPTTSQPSVGFCRTISSKPRKAQNLDSGMQGLCLSPGNLTEQGGSGFAAGASFSRARV